MLVTLKNPLRRDGVFHPLGKVLDLPDVEATVLVQSGAAAMGGTVLGTVRELDPWASLLAAAAVVSVFGEVTADQERALRVVLLGERPNLATLLGADFARDRDMTAELVLKGNASLGTANVSAADVARVVAAPASTDAAVVPAMPAELGQVNPPLVSTSDHAPPVPAAPALDGAGSANLSPAPISPDAPRDLVEGDVRQAGAIDPGHNDPTPGSKPKVGRGRA